MTTDVLTKTQQAIIDECEFIKQHLLTKNRAYGNSFAEPVQILAKSSPSEQLNVRIDDKIKRLLSRDTEAKRKIKEDTVLDLIGYLILKRVLSRLLRKDKQNA
jgi:hypothetical protein